MNTVTLSGNLTKDVELKYTPSGTPAIEGSIAINTYMGKDREPEVYFFDFFGYGDRWKNVSGFLKKGLKILLIGSLVQQSWVAKDGTKRYAVKIKLQDLEFCSGKNDKGGQQRQQTSAPTASQETPDVDINEENIPF